MPEEKKIEGKNANEWFDLGRKAKYLEEYDYAKKCYSKALELNPNDSIRHAISDDLEKIFRMEFFYSVLRKRLYEQGLSVKFNSFFLLQ